MNTNEIVNLISMIMIVNIQKMITTQKFAHIDPNFNMTVIVKMITMIKHVHTMMEMQAYAIPTELSFCGLGNMKMLGQ